MTSVLVVDDDQPLQSALRQALSRAEYDVAVASDRARAVESVATRLPDVVVLDLGLPDGDGVELLRQLRTWSEVPVLVLTGSTRGSRMIEAFGAGADDFLRKPFGLEELLARLAALVRRARPSSDENPVLGFGELVVDLSARSVTRNGTVLHLTPTEWRILAALVTNPGKLLTHRWLLEEVWDRGHGEETKAALRTHVRGLRAKLVDDAAAPRYVATESGAGYRWIAGEGRAEQSLDEASTGSRSEGVDPEAVHEINNALTAARLGVSLVRGRVRRHESDGVLTASAARELLTPMDDVAVILQRLGRLVEDTHTDRGGPHT